MARFIEADSGALLNLEHVVSIGRRLEKGGSAYRMVKLTDGSTHEVAATELVVLMDLYPVLPAAPGWAVVSINAPKPPETAPVVFEVGTVIAWAIKSGAFGASPRPITADGPIDLDIDHEPKGARLLMDPEGRVLLPEERSWPSLEACLADLGKRWAVAPGEPPGAAP
jgi:hypothetical protein